MNARGGLSQRSVTTGLVVTGAALGGALATLWLARRRHDRLEAFESDFSRDVTRGVKGRVEPEAAELPLGHTSDRDIDRKLNRTRLPQPESTGAVLFDEQLRYSGVYEAAPVSDRDVSARPQAHAHRFASADDYDAVSPEELGTAFLARATESVSDVEGDDLNDLAEIPGFQVTTMSEASNDAALLPDVLADDQPLSPLQTAFEGDRASDEDDNDDDEILADVFDRPEPSSRP
jgi:hypothetical protein